MTLINLTTLRFIIVGGAGALVYFLCSYLFLTLTQLPAFLASLLAYVCSFGFSYLGQKCWAFRSTASHRVTLSRYAILQIFCAIFAATFTHISVSVSQLSPLYASAIATFLTCGISYFASSLWVFSDSPSPDFNIEKPKALGNISKDSNKLLILSGVVFCIVYIFLYSHTAWIVNLLAGHDDYLFIKQAYSLTQGEWLGEYSKFTLMKGPGYAFFLALTHWLGFPLYVLAAILHCIAVSLFARCIYSLGKSKALAITIFIALLFIPLVISNGRVVRDQIYPDQFLLGFSALIYSLFLADTFAKRFGSAIISGGIIAWFWLTREEGVWILPSIGLLILFAIFRFWSNKSIKSWFISSVGTVIVTFLIGITGFKLANFITYNSFIGLDIKEHNFKSALSALQSVQAGELISHVPVTQLAMKSIYQVSPSFSELKPYYDSTPSWLDAGCSIYQWTCGKEYAGGWFIWSLRDAAASVGYYEAPEKAAGFFGKLAKEINQACDSEQLQCQKSLLAFMPKIAEKDFNKLPETLIKLVETLFLFDRSSQSIYSQSHIIGINLESKLAVLDFFHSRGHFNLSGKEVMVTGKYKNTDQVYKTLNLKILNSLGDEFPYHVTSGSSVSGDNGFSSFSIESTCPENCSLEIGMVGEDPLNLPIPEKNLAINQKVPMTIGNWRVAFEKVTWKATLVAKYGDEEKIIYKLREKLFIGYQIMLPILFIAGLLAFLLVSFKTFKKQTVSSFFVITCAIWIAIFARLTILLLVHMSSFDAINGHYFMPLYSLVLMSSMMSIYQFINIFTSLSIDSSKAVFQKN